MFDYSKLRGRIKEIFGTQDAFADAVGIGRVSMSKRLNNTLEFTQDEMKKSAAVLKFSPEEIPVYFLPGKFRKLNFS